MRHTIEDGYTVAGTTREFQGRTIEFRYRPPLFEELNAFWYAHNRCQSGDEQTKVVADFICAHVTEWDVLKRGGPGDQDTPAEVSPKWVRKLPGELVDSLLSVVTKWAPNNQAAQEGN